MNRYKGQVIKIEKLIKKITYELEKTDLVLDYETTPKKNPLYFKRINHIDNELADLEKWLVAGIKLIKDIIEKDDFNRIYFSFKNNTPVDLNDINNAFRKSKKTKFKYDKFFISNFVINCEKYNDLMLYRYNNSPLIFLSKKKEELLFSLIIKRLSEVVLDLDRKDNRVSYISLIDVMKFNKYYDVNLKTDCLSERFSFVNSMFDLKKLDTDSQQRKLMADRLRQKIKYLKTKPLPSYLNSLL